jgi:hypothetical protein
VVGEWWKRRGLAVVHQITPTISRPRTIIITMFQAPCPRRQGQADAGCRPPAPEKHVERLLAVVLKPRTTDQLGAGNGARWKTLPLHVEPKKKVRATDGEGDPALARVRRLFVCERHSPLVARVFPGGPLHQPAQVHAGSMIAHHAVATGRFSALSRNANSRLSGCS